MATRRISKEEEIEDMSPETVAKRLEIMRTLEHRLPYDPWAQPVETFGESASHNMHRRSALNRKAARLGHTGDHIEEERRDTL